MNVFGYENGLVFPVFVSDKKFENSTDLFLITNQILCSSKVLTDLCFTKQKIKIKNTFVRIAYNAFVVKIC